VLETLVCLWPDKMIIHNDDVNKLSVNHTSVINMSIGPTTEFPVLHWAVFYDKVIVSYYTHQSHVHCAVINVVKVSLQQLCRDG